LERCVLYAGGGGQSIGGHQQRDEFNTFNPLTLYLVATPKDRAKIALGALLFAKTRLFGWSFLLQNKGVFSDFGGSHFGVTLAHLKE
jgi:hypothetical protein